jgi:predicted DNA-binding protein
MTTAIPRINIALGADDLSYVKQLAKRYKTSISKICADLIQRQLEEDEDAYWIKLMEEENIDNQKTISAEEVWKTLNVAD